MHVYPLLIGYQHQGFKFAEIRLHELNVDLAALSVLRREEFNMKSRGGKIKPSAHSGVVLSYPKGSVLKATSLETQVKARNYSMNLILIAF